MASTQVRLDDVVAVATFRAALRAFLRMTEREARRHGLTPQRYQLMLMIKGAPDRSETLTVSDLAERLQIAQSTATELVTRAEAAGLVQRMGSPKDGRVALVRLTPAGERCFAECFEALQDGREKLRESLSMLGDG